MEKHKQYIFEWGGVNSEVIKAANILAKTIWKDSMNVGVYYSNTEQVPYVEGEFDFDFSSVGFEIDKPFKVTYTIYITDNIQEYNQLFSNVNGDESANSSTTFDEHRMNIVSGMIGGKPSPDYLSNVLHEVDHVFEYMKGYKKNQPLYTKVLEGINSDNEYVKAVAILMYYCFKHEQDAFVHQFYGALVQNQFNGSFEDAIYGYSEYSNLSNIKFNIFHKMDRNGIKQACKELGTSFEHIQRYSAYISKKMKNKLFKAYNRYLTVKQNKLKIEGILQQNRIKPFIFNEFKKRYKNIIIKEEKYIETL